MRRFEQRQLLGDGWTTEWEPVDDPPPCEDVDARRIVLRWNATAKSEGSNLRVRSVDVEDVFE